MADTRIRFVCPDCGSHNVLRDAYAEWNEQAQEWELHGVYDNFTCDDCGENDIDPEEEEINNDA
jgi:predicted RNA-binding Zn-ribbon protein involved in translation (DUF1610 family)